MKLGINLLCATGFVGEADFALFAMAAEAGFDLVEVPMLAGDPDDYAAMGRQLDALSLARGCTAISRPEADPTSADKELRRAGLDHLDWILDCAEALGAETVGGPFHAPIGVFTGAGPTADEWQRGAEAHHAMAEKAAARGMRLALEPLNRFETHFLNTAAQARAYADLVDHPAFGIMYDTFHAHIEEKDQVAAVHTVGDKIHVLHVSENDRSIPGTGQVAFEPILKAVRAVGFDGPVVVEAFGAGVPELAAATRIWRPMFASTEELMGRSAPTVRRLWDEAA